MATGGVLKAVCVLSATRMPKKIGSTWKSSSSGRKIGTKMMMISVHSSGQPSRKMMAWVSSRKPVVDRLSERKNVSTTCCPPSTAKTAEKVHEPMNREQTTPHARAGTQDETLSSAEGSAP